MNYFRIRNAIFAEAGFNAAVSDAAPAGLKNRDGIFVLRDRAGRPIRSVQIPGCDPNAKEMPIINLTSYRSDNSRLAVVLGCYFLKGALTGDQESQEALGEALLAIVCGEIRHHDAATQFGLLSTLYGEGFLERELIQLGNLRHVELPEPGKMIAAAFDGVKVAQ